MRLSLVLLLLLLFAAIGTGGVNPARSKADQPADDPPCSDTGDPCVRIRIPVG